MALNGTDELATELGKEPSGGYWNSGVAVLCSNGLIEISGKLARMSELFRRERSG